MELEIYPSLAAFPGGKPGWDELLVSSGTSTAFLGWDWLTLWSEYYASGARTIVLCARGDDGRPCAAVPLLLRERSVAGIRLRCVEFLGSGEVTPDHLGFISPAPLRRQFQLLALEYLAHDLTGWDLIRFTDMAADEGLYNACRDVFGEAAARYSARGTCPYIRLPSSWKEYAATLTSGRRQRIGKYERDLSAAFSVRFSPCPASARELSSQMKRLRELHTQRMRQRDVASRVPGAEPRFWEFQNMFAARMFAEGRLLFATLSLDGEIAACMYAFESAGAAHLYLSGIDIRFEKYSVGFVNIVNLIRVAIERGLREIDFLRGDEHYKSYFTSSSRANTELVVANRTARAALASVLGLPRSMIRKTVSWIRSMSST